MSEKPLESADPSLSSITKETLLKSGPKLHILIGHPWKIE